MIVYWDLMELVEDAAELEKKLGIRSQWKGVDVHRQVLHIGDYKMIYAGDNRIKDTIEVSEPTSQEWERMLQETETIYEVKWPRDKPSRVAHLCKITNQLSTKDN